MGVAGANDEPLFEFEKGKSYSKLAGGFQDFLEAFGQLPSVVALAMRDVVYDHNPHWDWRALYPDDEAPEGEEGEAVE